MKVAIMQPYLFPYIGYYQLVNAVDTFVFFDDVNYINKGWINRNQLLGNNEPFKFATPLSKASQNRRINEIAIFDYKKWRSDFLNTVTNLYKKAPYFDFVSTWLNVFFNKEYLLISDLASESVQAIAALLESPTCFKNSSSLNYKSNNEQKGEDKILAICKILEANEYINPINGMDLYNPVFFNSLNIQLNFINMQELIYPQFDKDFFVPNLSIIDVLMFNNIKETKELLNTYKLI